MKGRFTVKILLVCLVLMPLFSMDVYSTVVEVDWRYVSSGIEFYDLRVIDAANPYFTAGVEETLQTEVILSETDRLVFIDKDGKKVYDSPLELGSKSYISVGEEAKNLDLIRIVRGDSILAESDVDFCDGDGICEPCLGHLCSISESFASCGDCKSGGDDSYCDLERDGICDPDCDDLDGDCVSCWKSACIYSDFSGKSCKELNLTGCEREQNCYGGTYFNFGNYVGCCIGGKCLTQDEYVESGVELQYSPSMSVLPSGQSASSVLEYDGDYCLDKLKGNICDPGEVCQGEYVEYYPSSFCCQGTCSRIVEDEEGYLSEEKMMGGPEGMRLDSAEQVVVEEVFSDPEFYDSLQSGEFPHEGIAEASEVAEPSALESIEGGVSGIIAMLSDNLLWVGLGVVSLIVLLIVISLVRRPQESVVPAQPDIQAQIDALISQGKDYRKVEEELLARGLDKKLVDGEITKNYQRRLELQRQTK